MRFKNEHLTLAELGRVFGVEEKEVGKWLVELRLRSPRGYPMDASYVKLLKPQTWGQAHVWIAGREFGSNRNGRIQNRLKGTDHAGDVCRTGSLSIPRL